MVSLVEMQKVQRGSGSVAQQWGWGARIESLVLDMLVYTFK